MNQPAPMTEYKRPESVLVIVYTRTRKVLLLKRYQPEFFWQSVAGSLLWEEDATCAAIRELREETGIEATQLESYAQTSYLIYPLWRDRYAPGVIENTEYAYTLVLDKECDVHLDAREHSDYLWADAQQAETLIASHTNRYYVQQLLA